MKIIVSLALFWFASSAFACMNSYLTLENGDNLYTTDSERYGLQIWKVELDTLRLKNRAEFFLTRYQISDSIAYYSDYAATLVYLGKYEEAKEIYLEIESRSPNQYTTASNLGTVYELLGINDSALIWIKRGMELNPNSHFESEWIHVKILEAKLSQKYDFSKSVLGLDFGSAAVPENPHNYDLGKLSGQLWYQLKERTLFVKPQEPMVGSIFFDLGNIHALLNLGTGFYQKEHILEYYEAARTYGFESPLLDAREEYLRNMTEEEAPSKWGKSMLYVIVIIIIPAVFLYIFRRKIREALE